MSLLSAALSPTRVASFAAPFSRAWTSVLIGDLGTSMLRLLPAEAAHDIGMRLLRSGILDSFAGPYLEPLTAGLRVKIPGLGELAHPICLAAGFDKHAVCPQAFARMGFAAIEIGTVTPRPQPGNPKPRLFRLSEQKALINRMGFNSDGVATVAARLSRLKWQHDRVPLGVNCGKNKDTPDERALNDFLQVVEATKDVARYFVINVSSPNTPGLRGLATPEFLHELGDQLGALLPRTWVKLDPDRPRVEFQALIEVIHSRGYQGVILSNTHRVTSPEPGGLSGHPLMAPSTACLEWAHEVHHGRLPMIASGGVLSGSDVFHKLARGASAVQIYTALVYRGPWVVAKLLTELAEELQLRGFSAATDAIGSYYRE